jgi:PIN domain nuclease of toxin-antitoxin system
MMLLLDTRVFLWWRENSPRLSTEARSAIAGSDVVFVSVASAWEVAIKRWLGRIRLDEPFERGIEESRFSKLAVSFEHADAVARLEPHHSDPFDRMLLAQARVENLTLVTHDRSFEPYGQPVIWS